MLLGGIMSNRLFYTVKLSSSLLKEYKNNLTLDFNGCLESGLIISLSDSQMLKSIRDITHHEIDRELLESWYSERDKLKKSKRLTVEKKKRIAELQDNIYKMMYIPEYITVVMESSKDYKKIFDKGFIFNGRVYRRISCSASQARVSTIAFCCEDIKAELKRRLDCGHNMMKPLAPSKYNAYFGLYSSAIKEVTKPRFCIVPDCKMELTHTVDYVIEQDRDEDDLIEERTITSTENRFDGSGLITPEMAKKWGEDLGEDYTPCNFCLRYAFAKGMVNEFDILDWCKEYNNGSYIIKDIWGNDVDLREIDVILAEGMVKIWDYWDSQEHYEKCCDENGIVFGITKYSPKKDKEVLLTNYQYLQTLNIPKEEIPELCKDTVDYIKGVSYDNVYYSLLFMLGETAHYDDLSSFMQNSDNYWLKSLILNHNLLNDKYTKEKIRDMIVRRIELACLGRLVCRGNYVCICPDPFAYMEWICYRDTSKVKGLLGAGEAYNQFWNERNVTKVDSMRSPLTHFSEHGIDELKNTPEMQRWYRYCYSGYISNIHDEFTYVHAGSDFDYDIISSTDCKQFINGKFPNQKVVTYNVKSPKKKIFTEQDLFITDTFSFGTKIGQITNTCSSICAKMAEFPEGSQEYNLLSDRLKAGCAAQSRQIDKTKIGEDVKTMATTCRQFQHIDHTVDSPEEIAHKMFLNRVLVDQKPYFFKYKYNALAKEIKEYENKNNGNCMRLFSIPLKQLLNTDKDMLTPEQNKFVWYYYRYFPAINSDCVMNNICKYIESVDFQIKQKTKSSDFFDYRTLMSDNFSFNQKTYNAVKEIVELTMKKFNKIKSQVQSSQFEKNREEDGREKLDKESQYKMLYDSLLNACRSEEEMSNYLVYLFYVDKPSYSKTTLWAVAGERIYLNIAAKTKSFKFPIKQSLNSDYDLRFLYENYKIEEFDLLEESEYIWGE